MAMQTDEHNIIHNVASEINIEWIIQWLVMKKHRFLWSIACLGDQFQEKKVKFVRDAQCNATTQPHPDVRCSRRHNGNEKLQLYLWSHKLECFRIKSGFEKKNQTVQLYKCIIHMCSDMYSASLIRRFGENQIHTTKAKFHSDWHQFQTILNIFSPIYNRAKG